MPMQLTAAKLALTRGGRLLFSDLSFTARPGEILAVRGPNGVGKSSLLRCLAGLLSEDGGQISLSGAGNDERQSQLHYLGHADAVKPQLTVGELLRFQAALCGQASHAATQAMAHWRISFLADTAGQYLSAGQRRRVALARLTLAKRFLWLLDEPASALDAQARALLIAHGRAHCTDGGAIIVAEHEPIWSEARSIELTPVSARAAR